MATAVPPRTDWDDWARLLLRVTVAVLMLMHGIGKIQNGIGWMAGMLQANHLPVWFGYGVYLAEVVAPILLLLGIFTRPAALLIAFDMLMAILLARRNDIVARSQSGGWAIELEMLFLLASLAIFFLGSGRFGISKGRGRWD